MSYAPVDEPFAQKLSRSLDLELRRRTDVTVAWRFTNQHWNDFAATEIAILASDVFIPILSRVYLSDQFSQRELLLIISFQRQLRQVFPVMRRPLSVRDERNLPHTFRELRSFLVWQYPYGMFDLAEDVAADIARVRGSSSSKALVAGIERLSANARSGTGYRDTGPADLTEIAVLSENHIRT